MEIKEPNGRWDETSESFCDVTLITILWLPNCEAHRDLTDDKTACQAAKYFCFNYAYTKMLIWYLYIDKFYQS